MLLVVVVVVVVTVFIWEGGNKLLLFVFESKKLLVDDEDESRENLENLSKLLLLLLLFLINFVDSSCNDEWLSILVVVVGVWDRRGVVIWLRFIFIGNEDGWLSNDMIGTRLIDVDGEIVLRVDDEANGSCRCDWFLGVKLIGSNKSDDLSRVIVVVFIVVIVLVLNPDDVLLFVLEPTPKPYIYIN